MTRDEAIAAGLKTFSGRPCKHGHGSERYVRHRKCVECCRLRSAKTAARLRAACPPREVQPLTDKVAATRARQKRWYQDNRERRKAKYESNRETALAESKARYARQRAALDAYDVIEAGAAKAG